MWFVVAGLFFLFCFALFSSVTKFPTRCYLKEERSILARGLKGTQSSCGVEEAMAAGACGSHLSRPK